MSKKPDKFIQNDKWFYYAFLMMSILFGLSCALIAIAGIYLAVTVSAKYLLYAIFAILGIVIVWIFFRLFLSMLCDIKLIRDKLYNIESEELKEFHKNEDKNVPMK